MEAGYAYANARIRAMKSRLLDGRAYASLLAAASVDQLIELLATTAYREEIEAALVRYAGVKCVFEALRSNVAHTIGKIRTFFLGRPRELVAILLGRWDIFNLVTILRGQARGVAADEIQDTLIPAGELTEADLREMTLQPTIRATADLMLAWHLPYARVLADALRARPDHDLFDVETRLAQLRYREALAGLTEDENDRLVREMLMAEIDVANLVTLLRLCRLSDRSAELKARYGSADAMPLLVEGGALRGRALKELSQAGDVGSIVRGLGESPYARALSRRMEIYQRTNDMAALERGLEEFLALKGIGMFHRDPLTVAVPMGYVWAKSNEIANLRQITQGKALGLDAGTIRDELIWWVRE